MERNRKASSGNLLCWNICFISEVAVVYALACSPICYIVPHFVYVCALQDL